MCKQPMELSLSRDERFGSWAFGLPSSHIFKLGSFSAVKKCRHKHFLSRDAQHGLQFFGRLNVSREYICSEIFILIFLVNEMCFQTIWYKSLVPWSSKTYQIIWSLLYWNGFFTSRCRRPSLRVFQSWA